MYTSCIVGKDHHKLYFCLTTDAQNKKALEQAFTKGSVEGIQLSSHGKYN